VAYDGLNRKFYLQHGGAQNLTYLNQSPVLSPIELSDKDEISVGNTVLRFVPFCGTDFDWEELNDQ
jgi:pSer/pThr/pTyr-binding forkhead associated (FHA) protein